MAKMFKVLSITVMLVAVAAEVCAQISKEALDANAEQAVGNYSAPNLNYLGNGALGMMQSAWKDPLQHMGEGQSRPGYTKYYWSPDLILPVRLREGMYTLINFPKWEVVENIYIGDSVSFTAQNEGPSSIMVYPVAQQFVGVDTNMIVFGRSGNKYVFYLQSETVNTDRITNSIIDIEVVKGQKGDGSAVGSGAGTGYAGGKDYSQDGNSVMSTYTRDLQREDWIERIPVDPTKFRFDIEVYVPNPDDIIIAPERVWRDNIFTYIDLGEKALTAVQRPIVTLIVERSETPVGFRAAGPNNRLIIVEGMGDMVLRSGKRLVCLKLRRADSDGLENAVYAKSDEWDLQNAHASPVSAQKGEGGYEDVYGSSSAGRQKNSENGSGAGFFNNSSFFGNGNNGGKTAAGTQSYESMISGVGQNQGGFGQNAAGTGSQGAENAAMSASDAAGGSFWDKLAAGILNTVNKNNAGAGVGVADGNSNTNGANAAGNANSLSGLNALPKTTPIVAGSSNSSAGQSPVLTGEYEVKAGNSELITPVYNNENLNTGITYETMPQKQNNGLGMPGGKKAGYSENNSNPVLISPSSGTGNNKSLVSAETEALLKEFRSGKAFETAEESNISIELGTDEDVSNLEKLWSNISKRYAAAIGKYQPFYSVDTPADGQGKEMFHLRVGPVKSLDEGDSICSQLGRNGIFCSVVRIQ